MNHGLATMNKEIRMPFCFPHISVKKDIKLALNQVFLGSVLLQEALITSFFLIG